MWVEAKKVLRTRKLPIKKAHKARKPTKTLWTRASP